MIELIKKDTIYTLRISKHNISMFVALIEAEIERVKDKDDDSGRINHCGEVRNALQSVLYARNGEG